MTLLEFDLLIFAISIIAGFLGSLLGLGGGIIMVPVLTLVFNIDIHQAIGASIVSVIATSSGAAAAYVRDRMTNLRVAMFLEIATVSGALTGAFLSGVIGVRWLYIIFGLILGYSALMMFRKRREKIGDINTARSTPWADALALHGNYYDDATKEHIKYLVRNARLGLGLMYIAGVVSGLLGIGSGALKVTAMDLAMRLPIKVSTATSNFMIGVTAAASASVYFMRGDINPMLVAPVAAGVLLGATLGSRLLGRLQSSMIRIAFVVVLIVISIQMLLKGIGG